MSTSEAPTTIYVPQQTRTLLQPFYVISIVIGSLIALILILLIGCACWRRTRTRRRWNQMVNGGWARPVFQAYDDRETIREAKSRRGPTPVLKESVVEDDSTIHWERAKPLCMYVVPPPPAEAQALLLHLLGTPSFLTPHLFKRLRTIGALRSKRRLKPSLPRHPEANTSDSKEKEKEKPATSSDAHVVFLIAMPTPPPIPPISPTSLRSAYHEPDIPQKELCIGAVHVLWQRPSDQLHASEEEDEEEEEENDYASTMEVRRAVHRQRTFDPSPAPFSNRVDGGSVISSRYLGSYDDRSRREESILQDSTYEGQAYEPRHSTQDQYGSSLHVPSLQYPPTVPYTPSRPYTSYTQSVRSIPPTMVSVPSQAAPPSNDIHSNSGENELHVGGWESRPELHPGSWESRQGIDPGAASRESAEMGFANGEEEADTTLRATARTAS